VVGFTTPLFQAGKSGLERWQHPQQSGDAFGLKACFISGIELVPGFDFAFGFEAFLDPSLAVLNVKNAPVATKDTGPIPPR
jgi:hypothetical protein